MDTHVCIVSAAQPNLLNVVKVYDMNLTLLFVIRLVLLQILLLVAVHLERLQHDEVLLWFVDLQQLVLASVNCMSVLIARLAQFTVDCAPRVRSHMLRHSPVLVSAQPLSQAGQVNIAHGT